MPIAAGSNVTRDPGERSAAVTYSGPVTGVDPEEVSADLTASPARPDRWDVDVVLTSGLVARVRSIRPTDADPLRDLHSRLSPETRLLRFFTPMPTLPASMVERFVNVDQVDRVALVAELDEHLIAVGRYDRLTERPDEAEVAFVVDDRFQGEGIGSLLLEHLAAIGLEHGITRFVAETMANNEGMLRVFGSAGFAVERRLSGGIFDVSFPIEPTEESEQVRERRDHRSTVASLTRLLRPRTVAFLGDTSHALGHARMLADVFDGTMASVTPRTFVELFRGRSLPLGDLEAGVDLVVVDVPPEELGDALTRCAAYDAGVVVVLSGSPGGDDEDGRAERRRLARFARRHGMRVVGPQSLGVANTDPAVGLCLLSDELAVDGRPVAVGRGSIGVFAHSAATTHDILATLAERSLGISSLVSAGDKTDVSGNDLLEYWEDDASTSVVVLAVESFGNPRRFARLVERVGRSKPILILAPADPETEALCRRTGVIRADTVSSLVQTAAVFTLHPDWFQPPAPNAVVPLPVDADVLAEAEAALTRIGTGPVPAEDVDLVLRAVGLDGWVGPAGTTSVCGRQDSRFGPLVELLGPDGDRRVALAPLTEADLADLAPHSPALHDVLLRVGAAVADLEDLAELTVTLTQFDTPAHARAVAAPSPNGVTQIVRRLT